MATQPAAATVVVPSGAAVLQVLLYWEGHFRDGASPDHTITVNGSPVVGTLIGGPTHFFEDVWSASYRANITGLNLVSPGSTSLTFAGMDFNYRNNGVSVVVVYDDGTDASIGIRDGNDLAYAFFAPPLNTTAPQTYTFPSSSTSRSGVLTIIASSVEPNRPNAIDVTIAGTTTRYGNVLGDNVGTEWDNLILSVTIPAGATSATVQAISWDDATDRLPASLAWIVGALTVPASENPPPSGPGTGTPGYWMNHPEAWPVQSITLGGTNYSKAQGIQIMKAPTAKDKTYTLAQALIAAKLNVASGTNASCISTIIQQADDWMASHPVGSGVSGSSAAWKTGEPLYLELDAYNNGLRCAPSRDSLE